MCLLLSPFLCFVVCRMMDQEQVARLASMPHSSSVWKKVQFVNQSMSDGQSVRQSVSQSVSLSLSMCLFPLFFLCRPPLPRTLLRLPVSSPISLPHLSLSAQIFILVQQSLVGQSSNQSFSDLSVSLPLSLCLFHPPLHSLFLPFFPLWILHVLVFFLLLRNLSFAPSTLYPNLAQFHK